MISIIITSFKEPKTIGKAIDAFINQDINSNYELIVVAPDDETLSAARNYSSNNVKTLKDRGAGKSAALNLAVSKAKGNILVLTDGDVSVSNDSIKHLTEPLENKKIGAVSGNPVSIDQKNNLFGFWAHILTKIADERRKLAVRKNHRFFCSGYLFAIRKELFPRLPEGLLSEDGYISHKVYSKGYKIDYAPKAKVFVKFPSNFKDWIIQKKRSAGGYNQIRKMTGIEMRSFRKESTGFYGFFKHISNIIEFFWLLGLFLARIYLWVVIYRDVNFKKLKRDELWKRVESTK